MKKRTIKDFIDLYAADDEEKLVLIKNGTNADKTFLDNFWTAHTYALAMADSQTKQIISESCYLNWPLTEQERESGEYFKRFTKGKIYRIKARAWKCNEQNISMWYVTDVLEEDAECPALKSIWSEYIKPVIIEDEVLGTLKLDRDFSFFEGSCQWSGKDIKIFLDVDIEKKASWTKAVNVMKKLLAEQKLWDRSIRALAAEKLTGLANEWLADNDQTDRDPNKEPITEEEFAERILLAEISVSSGGHFTAWYEDDDMFWGHMINVEGTLKKGPLSAEIQG